MHPLRTKQQGTGPIVCPYHGWSFNYNGQLKRIPFNDECYGIGTTSIALRNFPTKAIGDLIFFGFKKHSTNTHFNKKFEEHLAGLSLSFQDVLKKTYRRKFNWKLAIENLKDGLHPIFVHQNSLNKNVEISLPGIPKEIPGTFISNKSLSYGGPDVGVTDYLLKPFKDQFEICPAEDRYLNYHIFPNIHIASPDGGRSFVIEHYKPIAPGETEIDVYYVFSKNNLDPNTSKQLLEKFISNAEVVYAEDFSLLETLQKNLKEKSASKTCLGRYERMIGRFYKVYFRKVLPLTYWRGFLFSEIKSAIVFFHEYLFSRSK